MEMRTKEEMMKDVNRQTNASLQGLATEVCKLEVAIDIRDLLKLIFEEFEKLNRSYKKVNLPIGA